MHGISTHAYEMCISQSFTINKCLVNEYLYFPDASSSQSIRTGDVHPTKYPSQNYGGLSLHYYFIWCRIIHLKTSAIYSAAFCNLLYVLAININITPDIKTMQMITLDLHQRKKELPQARCWNSRCIVASVALGNDGNSEGWRFTGDLKSMEVLWQMRGGASQKPP